MPRTAKNGNQIRDMAELELHRRRAVEMSLAGYTLAFIARELGISKSQVGADIKFVRERWMAQATQQIAEARGREADKLNRLEQTYWKDWEKNHNLKALNGVLNCIDRRAKLLGLDVVPKADLTDGLPASFTLTINTQNNLIQGGGE